MPRGWVCSLLPALLLAVSLSAACKAAGPAAKVVPDFLDPQDAWEAANTNRRAAIGGPIDPQLSAESGSGTAVDSGPKAPLAVGESAGATALLSANVDRAITFKIVDAEYSAALDRVVAVSTGPSALKLMDPETSITEEIALSRVPTAVSVSPDGMYAAVGHDKFVTYISLPGKRIVREVAVTADVLDLVLAGNSWVYVFPRRDQWETIRALELTTGREVQHTGEEIYAGTLARLHPDGMAIYGANNGLSPSDIEKYDISAGAPAYKYDSPYHGNYAMCGNLWFSQDGASIFTRCGAVFRATTVRATDMTYTGNLKGISRIQALAHSGVTGLIAAAPQVQSTSNPSSAETEIRLYDAQLNQVIARQLPSFRDARGREVPGAGKHVFYSFDGSRIHVIAQAVTATPSIREFALASYGGSDLR
ncbi:MAG: hypothetical protein FJZ00_02790 [Candidatus Sericytochromatia bacterium]|uniref:Lipoprotein n=1 Tax=Candidatus Tanganyikabacteria bacterium TaxID=2961651 RepID=A0A938BM99_9BACT|nr:hypothetical protein [Candidatus Tanganyikabacteria bacterium]